MEDRDGPEAAETHDEAVDDPVEAHPSEGLLAAALARAHGPEVLRVPRRLVGVEDEFDAPAWRAVDLYIEEDARVAGPLASRLDGCALCPLGRKDL